jgi:hypothetical protein
MLWQLKAFYPHDCLICAVLLYGIHCNQVNLIAVCREHKLKGKAPYSWVHEQYLNGKAQYG